jgi:hypothetical protein
MKQNMFIDRHMLPTRDLQKAFNAWVNYYVGFSLMITI